MNLLVSHHPGYHTVRTDSEMCWGDNARFAWYGTMEQQLYSDGVIRNI